MSQYVLYKKERKKARSTIRQGMWGFILIWLGQIVSLMGSGMTCFAQSVWVYTDLCGTITHLTALAVAAQLPGIVISPLAGVLVDRWDRRWVMIISDGVAALATLTLRTLIVTESFRLWHIYLIVVVISTANHFQWAAYFATVSLLIPKRQLGTANGLVQMGRSLGMIATPLLAGWMVTVFNIQGVILFDMATYLFSLVMLLIVRIPKLPATTVSSGKAKISPLRDVVRGWKYLVVRSGLVGLLVFFAISNFMFAVVTSLFMPLVLSITSVTVLGGMMSISGISMLVGSVAMSVWGGPKRRVYGVLSFALIEGIAIVLAGLGPSLFFLFSGAIVFYFAVPIVNACGGVIWQSKVAPEMQGRALAASGMVSAAAIQLGYLISGPLADHVFEPLLARGGLLAGSVGQIIGTGPGRGIALMFVVFGAFSVLVAIGGYLHPRIRRLDEELPDAVPQGVTIRAEKSWRAIETPMFPSDVA